MRLTICIAITSACLSLAAGERPEIASTNEGVRRGMVLQIYGEHFEPGKTKVYCWRPKVGQKPKFDWRVKTAKPWRQFAADTDHLGQTYPLPEEPPRKRAARHLLSVTPQVIALESEAGVVQGPQCFVVWVETVGGLGEPMLVNRAELWWLDKRTAAPGDRVRVFGRNLTAFSMTTVALRHRESGEVTLAKTGGDMMWASGPEERVAYEYRMGFEVPEDLAPGQYQVFLHNGTGDKWGWSNGLPIAVAPPSEKQWTVVNVSDFGAKGDGLADDTAAIEKAVATAAAKDGAWIHFPVGVFMVTRTIALPECVGLRGSGMSNTVLIPHETRPFAKTPPAFMSREFEERGLAGWAVGYRDSDFAPLLLVGSDCRLAHLTLECGDACQWTIMGFNDGEPIEGFRAEYVKFGPPPMHWHGHYDANAVKRGGQSGVTFFGDTRDVRVTHCNFQGGSVRGWGTRNEGWHVAWCTFDGVPNNYYAPIPFGRGARHCIIEHNRCSYPSRGWVAHGGAVHNFIFNNIVTQTRGDGGGEPYLFEGTSSDFHAQATGGDTNTIQQAGAGWDPHSLAGKQVLILKGRGFGQYRFIKDNTAETITVAEPWNVAPDDTTGFCVGSYFVENFVMANSDIRCNISHYYGNCIANVWASQRSFNALGFAIAGFYRPRNSFGPCYFNDLVDCSFRRLRGMVAFRGNATVPTPFGAPVTVGNRIARTNIEDAPLVFWDRWVPEKGRQPWRRWQTGTGLSWRMTIDKHPKATKRPDAPPTVAHNVIDYSSVRILDDSPHVYICEGCDHNVFNKTTIFDTTTPIPVQAEPGATGNVVAELRK